MAESKNPLEEEAVERLAAARTWKSYFELDIKEMYFMTAPHRQRQISSMTSPSLVRWMDYPELQTSLGFDLAGEFVTEVVNTFMPEAQPWCERGPGIFVPQQVWEQVADDVREADLKIFEAIKASNFYSELPKSYEPDLAIGVTGMWVDLPWPAGPINCMAVPLRELEINLGPYGDIDDRFAVRYPRNAHVPRLVGDEIWAKVSDETKRKIKGPKAKANERTQVVWGYWRDWSDVSDEVWQHTVLIGNECVHDVKLKGEGCCPLLVTRMGATADWPWGIGPLYKGLPDLRQADELQMRKMEAIGRNIAPPVTYPNDSFTNVEQGIEDGFAYPIHPGSEGAVKAIYPPVDVEPAVYALEDLEHRLRRLFYIDFPEQSGDTPPTLGQWLDQMARAQRRIGTPGMSFWREGPAQYFTRFKYLLERRGTIQPIKAKGGSLVSTRPMNPAQRAAEQQEVAQAVQAIQIASQAFPEEFKVKVDGEATMKALFDKMRVKLIKMRDKQQVAAAVDQLSKLVGARAGNPQVPQGQP
jgi:hypothetical protein